VNGPYIEHLPQGESTLVDIFSYLAPGCAHWAATELVSLWDPNL